jgi:hypothetical protein
MLSALFIHRLYFFFYGTTFSVKKQGLSSKKTALRYLFCWLAKKEQHKSILTVFSLQKPWRISFLRPFFPLSVFTAAFRRRFSRNLTT